MKCFQCSVWSSGYCSLGYCHVTVMHDIQDRHTARLTCVWTLEAQHGVVEHQQVCEPHGGTQVVEKVSNRIAEPPDGRQRALGVRHDDSEDTKHNPPAQESNAVVPGWLNQTLKGNRLRFFFLLVKRGRMPKKAVSVPFRLVASLNTIHVRLLRRSLS